MKASRITEEPFSVTVIPATKRFVQNGGQLGGQKELRVAAYCRVSTGDESQQTSYTKQKEFYSMMIQRKQGWKFAGIYADEAISGTSRARRVEFNRMMDDAVEGKLDYIVTKSISRFARNTVDTLNCVRQLQQQNPPVGIYFEKENIDTLDAKGELILTILSALAQDESRSISDNIRWTLQKKFQEGKPQINLNRMLGYDKGENGEWEINQEQAEIVRYIYRRFLYGCSANKIAGELNEMGKYTVNGKCWRSDGVFTILRNEKYVGDLEMQKTITRNFLTHRSVINTGEAPRYYVRDHHAGIVDRMSWDKVQAILTERGSRSAAEQGEKIKRKGPKKSHFSNLFCGEIVQGKECGHPFARITYSKKAMNYSDERCFEAHGVEPDGCREIYSFAYPVWRCSGRRFGKSKKECRSPECHSLECHSLECHSPECCCAALLHECAVEQSFMEMLYALKRNWDEKKEESVIARLFEESYEKACKRIKGNKGSQSRLDVLDLQIKDLEKQLQENEKPQNKAEWQEIGIYKENPESMTDLRKGIEELKREKREIQEEQDASLTLKHNFEFFLKCLEELPIVNSAGMKLNVNGLDVNGSCMRTADGKVKPGMKSELKKRETGITPELISQAPDYLHFEKGVYIAFIQKGIVRGDEIEYVTNFGVRLFSRGNTRTLNSFLGFRRGKNDGTAELLMETWQVNGKHVQYRRKEDDDAGEGKGKKGEEKGKEKRKEKGKEKGK